MAKNLIEIILRTKKEGTAIKDVGKELEGAEKTAKKTGLSFGGISSALGGLAVASAAVVGVLATVKKAMDLGREGAVILQTADSFDTLMEKVGASANTLDLLRAASGGTIDDMKLMSSTTTLLAGAQGTLATELANATPQLMEIAKAANKLNPTLGDTTFMYESLALGVKRASPMILDNLGLTIRIGEANEEMAKSLGKSVEALTAEEQKQALLNATLKAGSVLIAQAGGTTDSATDSFDQLGATLKNVTDMLKTKLTPATSELARGLSGVLEVMFLAKDEIKAYGEQLDSTSKTYEDYIDALLEAAISHRQLTENQAEMARAMLSSGATVEELRAKFSGYDEQVLETAVALGIITKAEYEHIKAIDAMSSRTEDAGLRMADASAAALKYAMAEEKTTDNTKALEDAQKALADAVEASRERYEGFYSTLAGGIVEFRELGQAQKSSAEEYEKKLAELEAKAKKAYGSVKAEFKASLPDKTSVQERLGMAGDAWDEWGLRLQDIMQNGIASPWLAKLQEMGMVKPPDVGVKQWAADLQKAFYEGKLPDLLPPDWAAKVAQQQAEATAATRTEGAARKAAAQEEIDALRAARDAQLAAEKEARQAATLDLALQIAEQTGMLQAWSQQKFGPDFSVVADSAAEVKGLIEAGILSVDSGLATLIGNTAAGISTALDMTGASAEENKVKLDSILSTDWAAQQKQKIGEAFDPEGIPVAELVARAKEMGLGVSGAIPQDPFMPITTSFTGASTAILTGVTAMGTDFTSMFGNVGVQSTTTTGQMQTDFDTSFLAIQAKGTETTTSLTTTWGTAMAAMKTAMTTAQAAISGSLGLIANGLSSTIGMTANWRKGLQEVEKEVRDIHAEFEKIPTEIVVTITTTKGGGLQHGGQWEVQGPAGIDNVPVAFRATAGEMVTVTPAGQRPPRFEGATGVTQMTTNQREIHHHWNLTVNSQAQAESVIRSFRMMQALAGA